MEEEINYGTIFDGFYKQLRDESITLEKKEKEVSELVKNYFYQMVDEILESKDSELAKEFLLNKKRLKEAEDKISKLEKEISTLRLDNAAKVYPRYYKDIMDGLHYTSPKPAQTASINNNDSIKSTDKTSIDLDDYTYADLLDSLFEKD